MMMMMMKMSRLSSIHRRHHHRQQQQQQQPSWWLRHAQHQPASFNHDVTSCCPIRLALDEVLRCHGGGGLENSAAAGSTVVLRVASLPERSRRGCESVIISPAVVPDRRRSRHLSTDAELRGAATGDIGIYITPKSGQVNFYGVTMTSEWVLNLFYTSPKFYTSRNKIQATPLAELGPPSELTVIASVCLSLSVCLSVFSLLSFLPCVCPLWFSSLRA